MIGLNELLVDKFVEVFGKEDDDDDPTNDFTIPLIPSFGNNDILPHNIFTQGPNRWTKRYLKIWRKFIPEEQRHGFERGGWFFVEVIPEKLAVFSINTLYFFDSNTAVDGCGDESEPGYEQMEWLRIQLQLLRHRGMKAILMGHVPPARTENKLSWDETCWQKYTLWMHQYRDVVVGSIYGHMNIDHFMLQDSEEVDQRVMDGEVEVTTRATLDDEVTVQSSAEYLSDLRTGWGKLPDSEGVHIDQIGEKDSDENLETARRKKKKPKKPQKSKEAKYFEKIGGEWGERYSLSLVGPSVVPNYYPTMRVIEYNITGLEDLGLAGTMKPILPSGSSNQLLLGADVNPDAAEPALEASQKKRTKHQKDKDSPKEKKKHEFKKPKVTRPLPPSKSSPPGPAYSPQTFTWLSLTQYFANLTNINNDFTQSSLKPTDSESFSSSLSHLSDFALQAPLDEQRWHEGKHSGKKPHHKNGHKTFKYEVEYDTRTDSMLNLTDLTVRSYIDLASRMGHYKPSTTFVRDNDAKCKAGDWSQEYELDNGNTYESSNQDNLGAADKKSKKEKKKRKRRRRKENEKLWFTFVRRAFVGSWDENDLREEFGNG